MADNKGELVYHKRAENGVGAPPSALTKYERVRFEMANKTVCKIDGCDKPARNIRGWCQAHYLRWWRHGDPLLGRTFIGEPGSFLRNIAIAYEGDDCLTWPYSTVRGYALTTISGKNVIVARVVCEARHGPPPSPFHQAAHSCGKGNKACVNPRHLRWATRLENDADKIAHGTRIWGQRNHLSKLLDEEVVQILALRGRLTQTRVAELFGVSQPLISAIWGGKTRAAQYLGQGKAAG